MSRYTDAKCRLCRREGAKLYLKGIRCEGEKCAFTRRQQAPGQHGTSRRRLSNFGVQLREKQKAKRIYGLLEKQFRSYVTKAMKTKGVTGEEVMRQLELRLDNMVYRSGFAMSRAQARQYVRRGFFTINTKICDIPSARLRAGDILKPVDFEKTSPREGFTLPDWLSANLAEKSIKVERLPLSEDMPADFNVQMIVEFYSR
ncbi:TPA: 30S ribosomal protein S4 [candidate division WWE3 bacterium]|uniref:Small ribosomal subunit protein uS4 n=5 Tax=Katanobacteria TaxID=422282 RepID=A0A0G1MW56_UNCKA|nr:MAG: 30S ribosomal protein S4 A [candidate division WWE3 bacterium GW2011_GWA2_44_16]KKT70166.1 MAG: 30S ribosomal protein S4 A [candidate division WWE3 bacterium GW2011_GWB1_44_4]KKT85022.1 MAG: 30S ribosomal protein S4 A [candidate division WWE3 bacterium GW2011_GWC2_44_9]OGC52253.1 MAG: 30S ribosomal protein S4 [candidate division WWE3 bacterium RIFCSPHIGHO2_01_FULL_43_9]HAZ29292.1 30S ribosomal protein S4 [candidate division WWE3 bacterium]